VGEGTGGDAAAAVSRLGEHRRRLGLTQEEVAAELARLAGRELPLDGNAVSRHERGRVRPSELYEGLYCRLYGAAVDELWPVPLGRVRPDRSTGGHLAGLVHCLRVADDTEPTGSLVEASGDLLALAERLTEAARPADRAEVGRAAAEAAALRWWLLVDAGQPSAAAHDRAMALAAEWAVTPLIGHLMGWRAGLMLGRGDLLGAVRLAGRARAPQWGMSSGGVAWTAAYEARAHVMRGSTDAARALDTARAAYEQVDPDREPSWLYFLSGDILRLDQLDMRLLAEGPAAAGPLEAVLAGLPPERTRDAAWYRAHLAAARARAGDVDAAAQDAAEAARLSAATRTTWTLGELRLLSRRPELALLREALADGAR
jgi:hypothetical protein